MTQTGFIETEEQHALRKAVAAMAANYGQDYYLEKARSGGHTDELWNEAGKLGFIGINSNGEPAAAISSITNDSSYMPAPPPRARRCC